MDDEMILAWQGADLVRRSSCPADKLSPFIFKPLDFAAHLFELIIYLGETGLGRSGHCADGRPVCQRLAVRTSPCDHSAYSALAVAGCSLTIWARWSSLSASAMVLSRSLAACW